VKDELYMQRCISLAKNALGHTSPNPMVGSLVVYNHQIIGEGYHIKAGEPHAEVNAINNVKDKAALSEATLYVNLEPCSHYGKTPPCADLIVKSKIKRVVIGTVDPYSKVAGKGIERLKNAGISVTVDVLKESCAKLNKRFFTFHNKKRPYVILKWAQTKDRFVDVLRDDNEPALAVTNKEASTLVHTWRAAEDAILIGKNTVVKDNPSLTTRLVSGKNPIRIVLGNVDLTDKKLLNQAEAKTILISDIKPKQSELLNVDCNPRELKKTLNELHKLEIQSVLVEGGSQVLQSFLTSELWDEVRVFENNEIINEGIKAPSFNKALANQHIVGNCVLKQYFNSI
jgi:diaminohydroxyphosphoribosylaminopyrimidine deaminase/5-amino-6-(5-phosphoribosylamino)uracil reductase